MSQLFNHAVLGGTFDHFHRGHEYFLSTAKSNSVKLTIGLVQTSLRKKILPHLIEPFTLRHKNLSDFIRINSFTHTNIIPLTDIYGTTLTDHSLAAIFVTKETVRGAKAINQKRKFLSLPPLKVIIVPHLYGDDEQVINSTRIRQGLINRDGMSYLKLLQKQARFVLPVSLRNRLRVPLGIVAKSVTELSSLIPPSSLIITVGDIVSKNLLDSSLSPTICVIDHHSKRQLISTPINTPSNYSVNNPSGTINSDYAKLFLVALSKHAPQVITVIGEEDLLTLPTILLSPLNSFVIYGQKDLGMVVAKVTESLKQDIVKLINLFNQ